MAHVPREAVMRPVRIASALVRDSRYKMLRLGKSLRRVRSVTNTLTVLSIRFCTGR
jgi:hypothetical protein